MVGVDDHKEDRRAPRERAWLYETLLCKASHLRLTLRQLGLGEPVHAGAMGLCAFFEPDVELPTTFGWQSGWKVLGKDIRILRLQLLDP